MHYLQIQRGIENLFKTVHEITLKYSYSFSFYLTFLDIYSIITRRELITSTSLVGNERLLTNVNTSNQLLSSSGRITFPSSQTYQSSISTQKRSNHFGMNGATHGIDSLLGKRGVCFIDSPNC